MATLWIFPCVSPNPNGLSHKHLVGMDVGNLIN